MLKIRLSGRLKSDILGRFLHNFSISKIRQLNIVCPHLVVVIVVWNIVSKTYASLSNLIRYPDIGGIIGAIFIYLSYLVLFEIIKWHIEIEILKLDYLAGLYSQQIPVQYSSIFIKTHRDIYRHTSFNS